MLCIRTILYPTDFSSYSNQAYFHAVGLAEMYGASLTVAYVMPAGNKERKHWREQLEQVRPGNPKIAVTHVLLEGDPATEIVDFVSAHKANLVMMPTHGYGPFRQLLLGSVTAKVLHDVHVPVWTTAHTGEAPDLEHLVLRETLCAVDANPSSIELIRWAGDFCKNLGVALRLVHAVPSIEAWPEQPMDPEFQTTLRENARSTILEYEAAAGIQVPVSVQAGAVADVVREAALEQQADLVIIGRGVLQGTMGRLRTHAYSIIRYAPCPVLSV